VKSRAFGFSIALAIFIADQITKWIVTGPLDLHNVRQIEIIPFFNLTWVENYGISLGLFEARSATGQWILIALTSAIAIGVAYWIGRERARWDQAALGMILGGAIGNILDRLRYGYVVDFADLHIGGFRPFLVFNVADAAISIGVAILLLRAFLVRDQSPEESVKNA
jgi:signal peptidase II